MKVLSYQSLFFVPIPIVATISAAAFTPVNAMQTRAVAVESRAAAASGKSQFASFNLLPMGWEVQPWQPPHRAPEVKAAAILRGDDGNQARFITFRDYGFAVQPWQPPHPRPERAGAVQVGDTGTQARLVGAATPFVSDAPRHYKRTFSRLSATKGRAHFAIYATYVPFWEVHPIQPPHPRSGAGAIPFGDVGLKAPDVTAVPLEKGWEAQLVHQVRPRFQVGGISGRSQFVSFTLPPVGWEIQSWQPPHPRPERSGSIQVGDSGIEAPFVFVSPTINVVFDAPSIYRRTIVRVNLPSGDTGTQAQFVNWRNTGWEVQPVQPPRRRVENAGAQVGGDLGNQGIFQNWRNAGWEIAPFQPPHWRPEQRGAFVRGDDGIQAPKPAGLQTVDYAWGYDEPYVYPVKRFAVWGAIAPRNDGTDARYVVWLNIGYEVQPVQPSHPRAERAGSIQAGDGGIYAPFIFVPPAVSTIDNLKFLVDVGRLMSR